MHMQVACNDSSLGAHEARYQSNGSHAPASQQNKRSRPARHTLASSNKRHQHAAGPMSQQIHPTIKQVK